MTAKVRRTRDTVTFEMPCSNHRSGRLQIITTRQAWLPGGVPPVKICRECRRVYPLLAYLKTPHKRGAYVVIADSPFCYQCEPPVPVPLYTDRHGRLRMRLDMRRETGEPLRWYDVATRRFLSYAAVGLRRMAPGSNVIRLQPYTERNNGVRATDLPENWGLR